MTQPWLRKQLIGLSVKSMAELRRAIALGANMVEIKLDKFAKRGTPLIELDRQGNFAVIENYVREISALAIDHGIEVQFHHWIERCLDPTQVTGINLAIRQHHPAGLRLFRFLEGVYREYGIGRMQTKHLPTVSLGSTIFASEEDAIENIRIFAEELDAVRIRERHETIIGFENLADPNEEATILGYKTEHFKRILRNTRSIGLTIDTGHRRLSQHHTVRELMQLGLPIVNFHFHGNDATATSADFDDDQHLLPGDGNVNGYQNYLRYFRRHRTPIVLEIAHLGDYSDDELRSFIEHLKRETA
jgi:sugar phosphate isomerase/epimerase